MHFAYHPIDFSRLNHGSFGSPPVCVLEEVDRIRLDWLKQPDAWYFGGLLESGLMAARDSALWLINGEGFRIIDPELVCLVENAACATAIVARRWQKQLQSAAAPRAVVFTLDMVYGGCRNCLREFLGDCDVEFVTLTVLGVSWPRSTAEILSRASEAIRSKHAELILARNGTRRVYGFFDHISSQPSFKLPVAALIKELRTVFSSEADFQVEVCVDGAHSVGSLPRFDVVEDCGDPDFFFSNVRSLHTHACPQNHTAGLRASEFSESLRRLQLHKWGYMAPTVTIMYARSRDLVSSTRHIVPSWSCGKGLGVESRFAGTRDYSAMLAVPAAVHFLQSWRSDRGESAAEFCHRRVCEAALQLSRAWGTDSLWPCERELVATQCMVRLPFDSAEDCPGRPASSQSLRTVLREAHRVEAAVGHFEAMGTFVRLSFAVYNSQHDIDRLERAVLLEAQRRAAR